MIDRRKQIDRVGSERISSRRSVFLPFCIFLPKCGEHAACVDTLFSSLPSCRGSPC
jgi:hypothetical protein